MNARNNNLNKPSVFFEKLSSIRVNSGAIFALIIISALFAFEIFNYSTTDFALQDLLGDLKFAGIRWATILSIAFCGIDFAGIARLFTPEQGSDEIKEVWYLFGAWLLAATMNAALTWWGVSMAITSHNVQSASVIDPKILYTIVPVFVALMVWVIRILIIGSLSMAGEKLLSNFTRPAYPTKNIQPSQQSIQQPVMRSIRNTHTPITARQASSSNHGNNTAKIEPRPISNRPEPTYHSFSNSNTNGTTKRF